MVRTLGVGAGSMCARFGGLLAPAIVPLVSGFVVLLFQTENIDIDKYTCATWHDNRSSRYFVKAILKHNTLLVLDISKPYHSY